MHSYDDYAFSGDWATMEAQVKTNMNILPFWFVFIAAAMRVGAGLAYVRAVITGRARPNPVSWLLWSITPMISFAASLSDGFSSGSVIILALGISPVLVFIGSMIRQPKAFKLDKLNLTCLLIALAGIGLWVVVDSPILAVVLAIAADAVSAIPTLVKIKKHPYSEYLPTYAVNASGMAVAILANESFNALDLSFPFYVFAVNIVIIGFILRARSVRRAKIRRGIARSRL